MRRINPGFFFPLLTLILLAYSLSFQLFTLPPLGKVLDPFIGVVQNENENNLHELRFAKGNLGLRDSVHVYFDERKVPHIYAANSEDLYFAQGYVTASLRLWEMDFLSYVASGRLSEVFGDRFLDYDRNQRRIGILEAARGSLKLIEKDSGSLQAITAYTRGINAYIHDLDYKKIPFEYKLFDYAPQAWSNLKTVIIMKEMGNNLSGYEEDLSNTNMMLALGEETFNKLFPNYHRNSSPMVTYPQAPINAGLDHTGIPSYLNYSFLSSAPVIPVNPYNPKLGSNGWAVSGKRTRSGFPILCNDPHLTLSLPAIWLEMQLSCPGMNVYGVSILVRLLSLLVLMII